LNQPEISTKPPLSPASFQNPMQYSALDEEPQKLKLLELKRKSPDLGLAVDQAII
jgi:hypothetical protein